MISKFKGWMVALVVAIAIGGVSVMTLANSEPDSPAEVVTNFYEHAQNGDIDKAKELVASEVIEYYKTSNWFQGTISNAITDEGSEYEQVSPKADTIKIKGKVATVDVDLKYNDNSKKTETYTLIEEDGAWKLTFQ